MVSPLALRLEAYTKLSQDDRARIDRLSRKGLREISARRDVLREGEKPRGFLVLDGWGCRYKQLPDGRRQIIALFLPGDIWGLNVDLLKEMDHSIGAITALKIAEISPEQFDEMIRSSPRVAEALAWDELVTLSVQREWTLNVGQRTAYERISHLLVELFLRLRAVGLTQDNSCEFPLTQVDVADTTGLTAVHVNRTLQELRKDGLVELQGRRLTIPDLKRLMEAGLYNENYLHFGHQGAHLDADD